MRLEAQRQARRDAHRLDRVRLCERGGAEHRAELPEGRDTSIVDLLTQGVVGAALAGVLADADTLIGSASDPLLVLEYHRHFTHALVFVPVGALVAAALLWPFLRSRLAFARLYLYALLGSALSGLLDACTSYGTHLLWPFSDARTAWSIVAVVDPVMTLAIALPLAIGVLRRNPVAARLGLALGACYLALGAVQHERAESAAITVARERGHRPQHLLVKPTLANLVLWRSIYAVDGRIHADAIRAGPFSEPRSYAGESAVLFDPVRDMSWAPPDSPARKQAERFARLAEGYVVRHPRRPGMLGDARYAMLPTSVEPLWGIVFDAERPDARATLVTERKLTPEARRRFLDMLRGR